MYIKLFAMFLTMATHLSYAETVMSANTITDYPGIIGYYLSEQSVDEDAMEATISIARLDGYTGEVAIDYFILGETATASTDFFAQSGTLNWSDGDNVDKIISLPIINDNNVEKNETLLIHLANGVNIGWYTKPIRLTIHDDDATNGLGFIGDNFSVNENEQQAIITVTRTTNSNEAISLDYTSVDKTATAGADYNLTSGSLQWLAGDTSDKTFIVPITDDNLYEGAETIHLVLSNPSENLNINLAKATLTIIDDDTPTSSTKAGQLSFSRTSYSVSEATHTFIVAVGRSNGADGTISVDYFTTNGSAIPDSDYQSTSGTLTWNSGDNTDKTFTITILDDQIIDADKTINLRLSNATNGSTIGDNHATLTIIDDETTPGPSSPGLISFVNRMISTGEGDNQIDIIVMRSNGQEGFVTVDYTTTGNSATADVDFMTTSGQLSWNDQQSNNKTINITLVDDTEIEANETFSVKLSNGSAGVIIGDTGEVSITLLDNDSSNNLPNDSGNNNPADNTPEPLPSNANDSNQQIGAIHPIMLIIWLLLWYAHFRSTSRASVNDSF